MKLPTPKVPGQKTHFTPPKPGVSDAKTIMGFGEKSRFYSPKKPVEPKSGVLKLGHYEGEPAKAKPLDFKKPFPPKLPPIPKLKRMP